MVGSVQPRTVIGLHSLLSTDPTRSAGLCSEKDNDKLQSSLGRKQEALESPPGEGRCVPHGGNHQSFKD